MAEKKHESTWKFRFALHEYFQPFLLSVVGALVGVILWFCVQVYEKIDRIDNLLTEQRIDMKEVKTNQINISEFKKNMEEHNGKVDGQLANIKISLALKNILVKGD